MGAVCGSPDTEASVSGDAKALATTSADDDMEKKKKEAEMAERQKAEEEMAKKAAEEEEAKKKAEEEAARKAAEEEERIRIAAEEEAKKQEAEAAAAAAAEAAAKEEEEVKKRLAEEEKKKAAAQAKAKAAAKAAAKKKAEEEKKKKQLEAFKNNLHPVVFFDIKIGKEGPFRIMIKLMKDICPKTAENFRCLCTGEVMKKGTTNPLTYKGTDFHKITPEKLAIGGDIVSPGKGESIYGGKFEDENFEVKINKPGIVSMANEKGAGATSQFQIAFADKRGTRVHESVDKLSGMHVAFGEVCRDDYGCLGQMQAVGSIDGKPSKKVTIVNCGQLE